MFKPCTPPVVPTPEVFLDSVVATRSEMIYGVPAFIEVCILRAPTAATATHTKLVMGAESGQHAEDQDPPGHGTKQYLSHSIDENETYASAVDRSMLAHR